MKYVPKYVLPCGNTACLTCIYTNFNIYTRKLKCCFDCQSEHYLTQNLNKVTNYQNSLNAKFFNIMVDYGHMLINITGICIRVTR